MRFSIDTSPKKNGPIIMTHILNKRECGVSSVGVTFLGQLCFNGCWQLFHSTDIDHVIFLRSSTRKEYVARCAVDADFDIYTGDGRVIEVHSCDRNLIKTALKYTQQPDIRAKYRAQRGR